jgi:feruloyl-CoA synthase
MDGDADLRLPFRDPRYAPRRLEVERTTDGGWLLTNPTPFETRYDTTLAALERWTLETPERVWLAERSGAGWRTVTYGEALEQVRALAAGLAGLELGAGDALLILARNSVDHALVAYAAMSLGAVAAPVSPQYGASGADLGRLAHTVSLLQPRAVFVEDGSASAHALSLPALTGLPVIASRPVGGQIGIDRLLSPLIPAQAGIQALARGPESGERGDQLLSSRNLGPGLRREERGMGISPDATAKLLLTSGSTGAPKAVIQTHRNIAFNAAQITACFDDPEPPVVVNAAPWSHSLGANAILHMVLHRGGTLYIDHGQPIAERFGETLRNLAEVSPTYHNMVPAGWALLADELERDAALAATFFARVRVLQYGGASMAQSVCDRVQAVALATVGERISFATGYGSTETGPTACNIHWPNFRTGMMGLPVPGTAMKLTPVGEKLEARVRGPQVSPGYLNAPELTAAAFDEDGFYRLGDAARLADPERPEDGVVFDGRLAENFKLASGTFVAAGVLRTAAVSACEGAVVDAVVCGEGRDGVGLLLFTNPGWRGADLRQAVRTGLERLNAGARGGAGRVARALILEGAPDAASGEITDKGYINQALARQRRAAAVERLYAQPSDDEVIVLG